MMSFFIDKEGMNNHDLQKKQPLKAAPFYSHSLLWQDWPM